MNEKISEFLKNMQKPVGLILLAELAFWKLFIWTSCSFFFFFFI